MGRLPVLTVLGSRDSNPVGSQVAGASMEGASHEGAKLPLAVDFSGRGRMLPGLERYRAGDSGPIARTRASVSSARAPWPASLSHWTVFWPSTLVRACRSRLSSLPSVS